MTAPAIELTDLHKNFGATQIIRGVSLAVPAGERHAIIGRTAPANPPCST